MLLIEAFIKFSTVGLLIAISLLLWRDGRSAKPLRFGLPLSLALICTFITTGHPDLSVTGTAAVPLRLFDMFNALFIWWFGLSLFDDDFRLGRFEWTIAAIYTSVMLPNRLFYLGFDTPYHPLIPIVSSFMSLAIMAHLVYRALRGRKDDLIEQRRQLRTRFALAVAFVFAASNIAERVAIYLNMPLEGTIWITYIFSFPIVIWGIFWLAKLHPEVLELTGGKVEKATQSLEFDAKEQRILDALNAAMQSQKVYRELGLSIRSLSERIDVPEHQLRALINQKLGFRNFTHFVNKYRIDTIKAQLANKRLIDTPILTLAIDAGFSSLAPFNRAFKASEGMTPSEYRQHAMSRTEIEVTE